MAPVVSVIVPSYNRHDKLLRALRSVRKQVLIDPSEIEIIVVNDCSKEESYYKRYVLSKRENVVKAFFFLRTCHSIHRYREMCYVTLTIFAQQTNSFKQA